MVYPCAGKDYEVKDRMKLPNTEWVNMAGGSLY